MGQGRKALFAAPMRPLPAEGTVTLRLRRGHAFSPDVTMTTTWLQEKRHVAASAHADMPTSESPAAVRLPAEIRPNLLTSTTSPLSPSTAAPTSGLAMFKLEGQPEGKAGGKYIISSRR